MLTPPQTAHFNTFGFLVLKRSFSPDEMAAISHDFDDALAEDRQGRPYTGEKRQAVYSAVETRPALQRLLIDDRVYGAIEQLLGAGFTWVGSDANLYTGDTPWHPDAREFDYMRIKVAFYLDPVTKDTGCLRVIPGSHRATMFASVLELLQGGSNDSGPLYDGDPRDVPSYPLESQPGDVVFFNQNTWHAAFGGKSGRRMFTLNFGQKPTRAEHDVILQGIYDRNLKHIQAMQYTQTGRVYDEAFLSSDQPRIKSMVAPLLKLGLK